MSDRILLGTRKGLITLERAGGSWRAGKPAHAGIPVSIAARDPRTGIIWAGLEHGHWGPKLSRSKDGVNWEDPPQLKYPEGARMIDGYENPDGTAASTEPGAAQSPKKPKIVQAKLKLIWALAFGHESQPGRIYVGTLPGGLFTSDDGGETFALNEPLWYHESRGGDLRGNSQGSGVSNWFGGGAANGQGGPGIDAVLVDPVNKDRVMLSVSCAGVFESTDGGKSWAGRNKGLLATFLPNPEIEYGHDVHMMGWCRSDTRHIWQQNHCGVFYSADGARTWKPVSKEGNLVHFGFGVVVDEKNGGEAWVLPHIADDKRMFNGALCVAHTQDGGQTWEELREGLPQENCYDVCYRHAFDLAGDRLCFASTTGNVYISENRGRTWRCLGSNFPPVYSVRFA